MTIFITKLDDLIVLHARAEGPGGMVGDITRRVRPGESEFGKTYEEWQAIDADQVTLD